MSSNEVRQMISALYPSNPYRFSEQLRGSNLQDLRYRRESPDSSMCTTCDSFTWSVETKATHIAVKDGLTRNHQVELRIEGQQMTSSDVRSANGTTVNLDPRTRMCIRPSLHCSVDIASAEAVREELTKSIHERVCAWSDMLASSSEFGENEVGMGDDARPIFTTTRVVIARGLPAAEQKLAREGRKVNLKAQTSLCSKR